MSRRALTTGQKLALGVGVAGLLAFIFRKPLAAGASFVASNVPTALGFRNGVPTPITLKSIGNGQFLEVSYADAFLAMVKAAAADGVTLIANSGFRSMEKQTELYASYLVNFAAWQAGTLKIKPASVAKPGFSRHQRGEAVDVHIPPAGTAADDPRRVASKEYQWLKANAHRFRFYSDFAKHRETWHWSSDGS